MSDVTSRGIPIVLVLLVALAATALALVPLGLRAEDAQGASYHKCPLSDDEMDPPGSKPTYNLSLYQSHTSCATAKKVMTSFHKCRSKSGYRCTHKVRSHWTCSGDKGTTADDTFYASFRCNWGSRRVKSTYQQNT